MDHTIILTLSMMGQLTWVLNALLTSPQGHPVTVLTAHSSPLKLRGAAWAYSRPQPHPPLFHLFLSLPGHSPHNSQSPDLWRIVNRYMNLFSHWGMLRNDAPEYIHIWIPGPVDAPSMQKKKKNPCRCEEVKVLEMERLSSFIWVDSQCVKSVFTW